MKRLVIAAAAVLAMSLLLAGSALADNGPHGGYTPTTDACAGCHRAHTAQSAKLLTADAASSAFCYTCHKDGLGAYTDVKSGVFISPTTNSVYSETNTIDAPTNSSLKGGGFSTALMNTNISTTTPSSAISTTSTHLVDGATAATIWGYGNQSANGEGLAGVKLTCVNCHNPHGNSGASGVATYRILKGRNTANSGNVLVVSGTTTLSATVDVTETSDHNYVVSNANRNYFGENYGTNKTAISEWCAQCHTRYIGGDGSGSTALSGDDVFTYRHKATGTAGTNPLYTMDAPGCLSCHVAHGTSAVMGTYSGQVAWPSDVPTPNDPATNSRSSLLRLDSRGVCWACHPK